MEKNPILTDEPLSDQSPHKSKPKRRPTACKDKRRSYDHCGLCGSANLAYHGIVFCKNCGKELEFLSTTPYRRYFFQLDKNCDPSPCNCSGKRNGSYEYTLNQIELKTCLDCGATGADTCPICGQHPRYRFHGLSSCWTGKYGDKFCQACGFRSKPRLERLASFHLYSFMTNRPRKKNVIEFLIHGVKYIFPFKVGDPCPGIATAYAAPIFQQQIAINPNDIYVWPFPDSPDQGRSVQPLHPCVPSLSLHNEKIYALFSSLDALSLGRAREISLAKSFIETIILS